MLKYLFRSFFEEDNQIDVTLPNFGPVTIKYRNQYGGSLIRVYKDNKLLFSPFRKANNHTKIIQRIVDIDWRERKIQSLIYERDRQYNEYQNTLIRIDYLTKELQKLRSHHSL